MTVYSSYPQVMCRVGQALLASLFLLGGMNKLLNYHVILDQMYGVGLAFAELLLPLVVLLEIVAGLAVALGGWRAIPAAVALAVFSLLANFLFHDFWNMEGQRAAIERALFFKNVSIAGGLIFVAGALLGRSQAK